MPARARDAALRRRAVPGVWRCSSATANARADGRRARHPHVFNDGLMSVAEARVRRRGAGPRRVGVRRGPARGRRCVASVVGFLDAITRWRNTGAPDPARVLAWHEACSAAFRDRRRASGRRRAAIGTADPLRAERHGRRLRPSGHKFERSPKSGAVVEVFDLSGPRRPAPRPAPATPTSTAAALLRAAPRPGHSSTVRRRRCYGLSGSERHAACRLL